MSESLLGTSASQDANGMVGRYCAREACGGWFKVHPETGVEPEDCVCPYCAASGDGPGLMIRFLETLLEPLRPEFEVPIACDRCSLEFTVARVYGNCPYCKRQSAYRVFGTSLEVVARRLRLIDLNVTSNLHRAILDDCLRSAQSAFATLCDRLRTMHPEVFPAGELPLTHIATLDACLTGAGTPLAVRIGPSETAALSALFVASHAARESDVRELLVLLTRLGASLERDFREKEDARDATAAAKKRRRRESLAAR